MAPDAYHAGWVHSARMAATARAHDGWALVSLCTRSPVGRFEPAATRRPDTADQHVGPYSIGAERPLFQPSSNGACSYHTSACSTRLISDAYAARRRFRWRADRDVRPINSTQLINT